MQQEQTLYQLPRECMIVGHKQRQIEYVCIYPECTQTRFLCSKCLRIGNHKHEEYNESHIFDHKELYEILKDKINKRQSGLDLYNNQGAKLQIESLKLIMQEIQIQLKTIINLIDQLEVGLQPNINLIKLNEFLMKLNSNGFNQFEENQINMILNIDRQTIQINEVYEILQNQSNNMIKSAQKIQEWCLYQQIDSIQLLRKIKFAKHKITKLDEVNEDEEIYSSAISNNFEYVVSGGTDQQLKIWNYNDHKLIKQIKLDSWIYCMKFTEDSQFLYVGTQQYLYQFDFKNQFFEKYKQSIHLEAIINIFCISNTIILTSSSDKTIIKTDVNLKQQQLLIIAHDDQIDGLDFNRNLNLLASASYDKSIKIWNGNNGQLIIEKQNAHNTEKIYQILFIIDTNQLISLDNARNLIIWNLNYDAKQIEISKFINNINYIVNISLMLNQQYISLVCKEQIKIYSIKGEFIRAISHDIKDFIMFTQNQPSSMKALLIQGKQLLKICYFDLD